MKANVLAVFGFSVVIRRLNFLQHLTMCKYFVSQCNGATFEDGCMITDATISDKNNVYGGATYLQSNEFLRFLSFAVVVH